MGDLYVYKDHKRDFPLCFSCCCFPGTYCVDAVEFPSWRMKQRGRKFALALPSLTQAYRSELLRVPDEKMCFPYAFYNFFISSIFRQSQLWFEGRLSLFFFRALCEGENLARRGKNPIPCDYPWFPFWIRLEIRSAFPFFNATYADTCHRFLRTPPSSSFRRVVRKTSLIHSFHRMRRDWFRYVVNDSHHQTYSIFFFLTPSLPFPSLSIFVLSSFYGEKVPQEEKRTENIFRFGKPEIMVLNAHPLTSPHPPTARVFYYGAWLLNASRTKKRKYWWNSSRSPSVNPQLFPSLRIKHAMFRS